MTEQELVDLITKASDAYWIEHHPIMSDGEYDRLIESLRELNPSHSLLNTIEGPGGKVKLPAPMLSLQKAYSYEDVVSWIKSDPKIMSSIICVQPKYDGISCCQTRRQLLTRGDGIYGSDITNIVAISDEMGGSGSLTRMTLYHPEFDNEPVYGELVVNLSTFHSEFASGAILNQKGEKYADPRSAVAGLANRNERCTDRVPKHLVTFYPYRYSTVLSFDPKTLTKDMFNNIIERVKTTFNDVPIDGVVFTLRYSVPHHYDSLGSTAHHPKGAIAYKFQNEMSVSKLMDITWNNGCHVMTPVATIEPITVGSKTIRYVTMHNYDFFTKLHPCIDDYVSIELAGTTIPKLTGIVRHSESNTPIEHPETCPDCGSEIVVSGSDLMCSNHQCPGKLIRRMMEAAKHLRIDGIGYAVAYMLVTKLGIRHIWDLLKQNYAYQIRELPGFSDKSAETLYRNVEQAVGSRFDYELGAALNIRSIGKETFKKLYKHIGSRSLLTIHEVTGLENIIGLTQCLVLKRFIYAHMDDIRDAFRLFKPMPSQIQQSKGLICCSGTAPDLTREQVAEKLMKCGYSVTQNFTKYTTCVLTNDLNSQSAKCKMARDYGIPVVLYQDFLSKLDHEKENTNAN